MGILSSLLGLGKATPIQQVPQQITTPEVAKEVAPFLKDILGKGQALYKQRMDEGYVPFKEPGEYAIAPQQAEQLQAQKDILGLVGTQAPAFEEARGLVRGTTARPTAEGLQEYMSPYQQAVIDVEQRRAQEKFESDVLPKIRQAQIGAGAFGGTRGTMLEAQALADQSRLISDIESTGRHKAFTQAQTAFEAQKAREAQAAQGLTGLATGEFGAKLRELGQMEAVGREKQQLEQAKIDEDYKKFLESRAFPEQQLGTYQTLVTGASPLLGQGSVQMGPAKFQPTPIAQALGTGMQVADIYGRLTNPGGKAYGGQVGSGLASLPIVRRQASSKVIHEANVHPDVGVLGKGEHPSDVMRKLNIDPRLYESLSVEEAKEAYKNRPEEVVTPESEGFMEGGSGTISQEDIANQAIQGNLSLIGTPTFKDISGPTDPQHAALDELAIASRTRSDKLAEDFATQKQNIELEKQERRELERSKILRGLAKGLLAPKEGRGGLWADIQAATTEGIVPMEEFEGDTAMFREKERKLFLDNVENDYNRKVQNLEIARARGEITDKEFDKRIARETLNVEKIKAEAARGSTSREEFLEAQNQARDILTAYLGDSGQLNLNSLVAQIQQQISRGVGIGTSEPIVRDTLRQMGITEPQIDQIIAEADTGKTRIEKVDQETQNKLLQVQDKHLSEKYGGTVSSNIKPSLVSE